MLYLHSYSNFHDIMSTLVLIKINIILLHYKLPPPSSPPVVFPFSLLHKLYQSLLMGIPKPPRGKLPLSIIITIICVLAFITLFFTEQISFFSSSSIFRFKPCDKRRAAKKSVKGILVLKIILLKNCNYLDDIVAFFFDR